MQPTVTIDACHVLIDNISRTLFATANDELRPVMNGMYFDLTADSLAIVASDGHKLVRNKNFSIKSDTPAAFRPSQEASYPPEEHPLIARKATSPSSLMTKSAEILFARRQP